MTDTHSELLLELLEGGSVAQELVGAGARVGCKGGTRVVWGREGLHQTKTAVLLRINVSWRSVQSRNRSQVQTGVFGPSAWVFCVTVSCPQNAHL